MVGIKRKYAIAVGAILQALSGAPSVEAKLGDKSDSGTKERAWKDKQDTFIVGGQTVGGRVVGGETVPGPDVYPFFVNWENKCGGSLVNSYIVLTAAHCNQITSNTLTIGAYELNNPNTTGAVTRTIVDRAIHPQFNSFSLIYDFAVLVLDEPVTTIQPIPINFDESTPTIGQNLVAIGIGSLSEGGPSPQFLQQATLPVISDEQCKLDYADYPFAEEVMFCAGFEEGGIDSCQGDSGGPIFSVTDTGAVDKQVGITSWGLGCARPGKPGVYSEISAMADWIFGKVCALSNDRPTDCPPPTAAPTPVPPGEGEAAVQVNIVTDRFAQETGWSIFDESSNVVESVEPGSITEAETLVSTTLNLEKGKMYTFEIVDSYGDGICCTYGEGSYSVQTGDLILASGAQFGASEATEFVIPEDSDSTPPGPTNPGESEIELSVDIFTDQFPREVAWSLQDVNGSEVASAPLGSYTIPSGFSSQIILLESEQVYNFTITDKAGDGLCCKHGEGNYSLVVNGTVLASGAEFGDRQTTIFIAPSAATPEPTSAPTAQPSIAPTIAPTEEPTMAPTVALTISPTTEPTVSSTENSPDEGDALVEVNIYTDRYPFETSWSIVDSANVVVLEAPPGTYTAQFSYSTSQVFLEIGEEYTFTIRDEYSDGLCCGNGFGNYSVTTGEYVLATGGEFLASESTTFVVPGGSSPPSGPDEGQIVLNINILTDEYPREIAWFLHDDAGTEIASSPLGSYIAQGELITTDVVLDSGVEYNFTIFDKGDDGLCCDYGVGNYSLVAGDMVLASGAEYGEFETTIFVAPTYTETFVCLDTSGVFIVDDRVGSQGCDWLITNKARYPWLCEHVDVAVTCPVTCAICEHLTGTLPS